MADKVSEKLANISNALETLERQYVEHKEKFEKWKLDNAKQRGSDTYNKYVQQFNEWEAGVQERTRQLMDERSNFYGYTDIDHALDRLLARISLEDFMLAIATMTSKDSNFFSSLLAAFKKMKSSGEARQSTPYQTFSTAGHYAANVAHPYSSRQYLPTAAAQPAMAAYPSYAVPPRAEVLSGNAGTKRSFERVASAPSTAEGWKGDEPARKSFRPPSPVKDYRNPSTLPFRDFSQA